MTQVKWNVRRLAEVAPGIGEHRVAMVALKSVLFNKWEQKDLYGVRLVELGVETCGRDRASK